VVLANILSAPLIALAKNLQQRTKPDGEIVLSGILTEQAPEVIAAYAPYFNLYEPEQDGGWIRLNGQLKPASELIGDGEHITQCPQCSEGFYINAEDLMYANGRVRCGNCEHIFYALDYIQAEPEPEPTADTDENTHKTDTTGFNEQQTHLISGIWVQGDDGLVRVDHTTADTLADTNEVEQLSDTSTFELHTVSTAEQFHDLDEADALDLHDIKALQNDTKKPQKQSTWWLASILALLTLGAQYIHSQSDRLALHPTIGQPIQKLYSYLPLDLEPDWDLDAYVSNASSVALNPLQAGELIANFNLSNMANHAQIFPIIRLSMLNRWSETIAYRDLGPEDYLDNPADSIVGEFIMLGARQRAQVQVVIKDPGSEAIDYQVEVCLKKSGRVRCQNKIVK